MDIQKYGFLGPYLIQFVQCLSNNLEMYIQKKLIEEKSDCYLCSNFYPLLNIMDVYAVVIGNK